MFWGKQTSQTSPYPGQHQIVGSEPQSPWVVEPCFQPQINGDTSAATVGASAGSISSLRPPPAVAAQPALPPLPPSDAHTHPPGSESLASRGLESGAESSSAPGPSPKGSVRKIWDAAVTATVAGILEFLPRQVGNLLCGITAAVIAVVLAASLVFAHHVLGIPDPSFAKAVSPTWLVGGTGGLFSLVWALHSRKRKP